MTKLLALIAWIEAHAMLFILLAVFVFAILFGVRSCKDKDQSKDAAVMAERIRVDSLKLVGDSIALENASKAVDAANAQSTRVVDRWHTVKEPVYLPANSTPHDTIQSIAKRLNACYQVGDSLVQSIVKIQSSCQAFRDTATKTIADQKIAYAHLDSLLKIGKPPRRWGISVFAGYGLRVDSSWAIKRGVVAGVGLSYSIIQW